MIIYFVCKLKYDDDVSIILLGLVLRTVEKPDSNAVVTHAPVTLLPSPVPKALYEYAQGIQNNINLLMHRIAVNRDFLWKCLEK